MPHYFFDIKDGHRLVDPSGSDVKMTPPQLHLAPPTDQSGAQKLYSIVIMVGSDRHVIEVAQGPAGT
jgi:hypothetical protein